VARREIDRQRVGCVAQVAARSTPSPVSAETGQAMTAANEKAAAAEAAAVELRARFDEKL